MKIRIKWLKCFPMQLAERQLLQEKKKKRKKERKKERENGWFCHLGKKKFIGMFIFFVWWVGPK